MSFNGAPVMAATVVAVDVGKNTAVLSVTDSARHRLLGPVGFAMTAAAVAAVVERVSAVLPAALNRHGFCAALMWVAAHGCEQRSGAARTRLG